MFHHGLYRAVECFIMDHTEPWNVSSWFIQSCGMCHHGSYRAVEGLILDHTELWNILSCTRLSRVTLNQCQMCSCGGGCIRIRADWRSFGSEVGTLLLHISQIYFSIQGRRGVGGYGEGHGKLVWWVMCV